MALLLWLLKLIGTWYCVLLVNLAVEVSLGVVFISGVVCMNVCEDVPGHWPSMVLIWSSTLEFSNKIRGLNNLINKVTASNG